MLSFTIPEINANASYDSSMIGCFLAGCCLGKSQLVGNKCRILSWHHPIYSISIREAALVVSKTHCAISKFRFLRASTKDLNRIELSQEPVRRLKMRCFIPLGTYKFHNVSTAFTISCMQQRQQNLECKICVENSSALMCNVAYDINESSLISSATGPQYTTPLLPLTTCLSDVFNLLNSLASGRSTRDNKGFPTCG